MFSVQKEAGVCGWGRGVVKEVCNGWAGVLAGIEPDKNAVRAGKKRAARVAQRSCKGRDWGTLGALGGQSHSSDGG